MALTVEKASSFLRRRLDGETSVDTVTLCNLAGRHLTGMHSWEWLVRSPVTITAASGRSEIRLPSDFGRIVKLEIGGSTVNGITMTTPTHLLELENSLVSLNNVGYWVTVIWGKDECGSVPVLRVYPSIGATTTLQLYYYAGWVDVTEDNDAIGVPPFIEALFLELLFAFAQGYDEHDMADINDRLARIHTSPVFAVAVDQDASMQDELGELRGGVLSDLSVYQSATIVGGPYSA